MALYFSGCEVINPAEEIPAFLHVEKVTLSATHDQGTSSHNITDIWVYVDQNAQGVYEMPVTFPVLVSGSRKLQIRPGIILNGISSTRYYYPFFKSIDLDYDFIPGIADTLTLVATYRDDVKFVWLEDFEGSGISIEEFNKSDTTIERTNEPGLVFEGNGSAVIFLDKEHSFFEGVSTDDFVLPSSLAPVYLEMNFKTNNTFVVGLVANSPGSVNVLEVLVMNTTDHWKKIYIYLSNTISRQSGVTDYNIYFAASLDDDVEMAEILIDNIKLLHF